MFKSSFLGAAAIVLAPFAANAAVSVTSAAGNTISATPGVLITFDAALPAGYTASGTGYVIQSGSNGIGAAPAGDTTQYLSVYGGNYSLLGKTGYSTVSLYWGSIDGYNSLDLLDAAGNVTDTVLGSAIPPASGDQSADSTNRRVTIASTSAIYGINVRSTQAAFEADDVKFQGAVPEPASWAMMIGGFGMVGAAMRRRRVATLRVA